jgi:hypothetical protein
MNYFWIFMCKKLKNSYSYNVRTKHDRIKKIKICIDMHELNEKYDQKSWQKIFQDQKVWK